MDDLKDGLWELLELLGGIAALMLPFTVLAPGALILVAMLAIPVGVLAVAAVLVATAVGLPVWALRSLWRALTTRPPRRSVVGDLAAAGQG